MAIPPVIPPRAGFPRHAVPAAQNQHLFGGTEGVKIIALCNCQGHDQGRFATRSWGKTSFFGENYIAVLWHETGTGVGVLIAIPNCQGRVSPVFDVASRLLVVQVRGSTETERREVVLIAQEGDSIVRDLKAAGVKTLICGAISQELCRRLENAGIRVVSQICGEIDAVLAAHRTGTLNTADFLMPGCCRHLSGMDRRRRRHCGRRAARHSYSRPLNNL